MLKYGFIYLLACFPLLLKAQIGGQASFEFLNLAPNARNAALGTWQNVAPVGSNSSFLVNPALGSIDSTALFTLSYQPFYADVNLLNLTYQSNLQKWGRIGFGVQYLNYGQFEQTLPNGQKIGTFNAQDVAIIGSYAKSLGAFHFGANIKFITSKVAAYQALALATDIGVAFKHPEKDFMMTLSFHHLGGVLQEYSEISSSELPLDIRFGVAIKPRYMPFRFSLTFHHLQQWDISYQVPVDNSTIAQENSISFFDNMMRHVVLGGEFIIHKNFNIRFGYNHLINRELRLETGTGFSGFSWGLRLHIKKIDFAYSRNTFHTVGGRSFLTIAFDMQNLRPFSKKTKP